MPSIINGASWPYDQVANRVVNLGYAGVQAYKTAISGVSATRSSAAALANDILSQVSCARRLSEEFNTNTANTYLALLRVFNPNAKCDTDLPKVSDEKCPTAVCRSDITNTPVALRYFAIQQQNMMNYLNKGNWLNRNVTGRLAAPLSAVAMIVYATARTILGVGAAVLSMTIFGSSETLNSFAWHNLNTPGFMINQLQSGLFGIVHPHLV